MLNYKVTCQQWQLLSSSEEKNKSCVSPGKEALVQKTVGEKKAIFYFLNYIIGTFHTWF